MKKMMMIALLITLGIGIGKAQSQTDSEKQKCETCTAERGVPFLTNRAYADRLFKNVGTVCTCENPTKQEVEPSEVRMTKIWRLTNINADKTVENLNAVCELPEQPEFRIVADEKTNSIIAMGRKDDLDLIEFVVGKLDKPKVVRTSFTTPVKPQDDLAGANVELRIENAIIKNKLEAMEEKM